MAKAKQQKVKTKAQVQIPQDLDQANDYLRRLGEAQRQIVEIEADATRRIDEITAEAEQNAKLHKQTIKTLFKGLQTFAEARRAELTQDGKRKTIKLAAGELLWRMTPPAVKLAKGHTLEILSTNIQLLGIERFLRRKVEADRDAMLKEPDVAETIPGVSISQVEEFVAKPIDIKVEEVVP